MSSDSEGKEVPMVSMHDENDARVSDDGSSGFDLVSSEDTREFKKASLKNAEHGRLYREKGQAGKVPGDRRKEHHNKAVVSNAENDSMLSIVDNYAENEKSPRVGHGYEVGDMVWAKVKSHPWWPGHIFNGAFATSSVRKSRSEGHVLVAFFGDSSYGWFEPPELIPFEPNFPEKSRQTTSRTFVKAVEDAVDELNKRRSLAFACRCRNPYSFRPTKVKGYLAVDFSDNESGIFPVSQIRRARDGFVPGGMLKFMKELALKPMNSDHWSINFIQEKASYLAYRKAVYEEFDETYAQAFGAQTQRPDPASAPLERSRAPLSGRLVFAEALGKVKSPRKLSKPKDQSAKDKYVLKRRDNPLDPKSVENSHEKSSDLEVKEQHPDTARSAGQYSSPDVSDAPEPSQNPQSNANEISHDNLSETHHSEVSVKKSTNVKADSELKQVQAQAQAQARKCVPGDVDSKGIVAGEKIKKRKKDLTKKTKLDPTNIPSTADGDSTTLIHKKIPGPPVREDLQINNQENDLARHSLSQQLELPQLLDELRDLALDTFYGFEKKSYGNVRNVFMNFRSLVYLKSPSIELKEARPSVLSSLSNSSEDNIPEKYKVMPSAKRPPSDHLEETAVKKKKVHDVKLLAAEKRGASKYQKHDNTDVHRADVKARKPTSVPPLLIPTPPAKAANRMMMLVMKFPSEAALPSSAELRAKFTRFGPMDYNATRIFYNTHTCRVVYHRKTDAEGALNFARSNFGGMNVKCYLREKENEVETSEVAQLKSILKKPPSSEDGGGGGGSGGVSKGRVKFILGGEDDVPIAKSHGLNNNINNNNSSNNTDKFQMVVPQTSSQFPFAQSNITKKTEIQTPPINMQNQPVVVARGGGGGLQPPPNIDIREQMLSLLSRCECIMKTLEGAMGYVPYHL